MNEKESKARIKELEVHLETLTTNVDKAFVYLQIGMLKDDIFLRKNFPQLFTSKQYEKQVPNLVCIDPLAFVYKEVAIKTLEDNIPVEITYNEIDKNDAEDLIDFIAYQRYAPFFIETPYQNLNERLTELYDMIGFDIVQRIHYSGIPLKPKRCDVYKIDVINEPKLLSLYHTALKQPEPLAKCVFLFRMIEYSYSYSNKDILKPTIRNRKDYPEYVRVLYNDMMRYRLYPLLCSSFGLHKSSVNIIPLWKKQGRQIASQIGDIGERVYKYGRCGIAHAGDINTTIFHDYSNHYKNIFEINIILNLICRYLIERENPEFSKLFKRNFQDEKKYALIR